MHWGYWQKAGLIFLFRVFLFILNLPGEFILNEWRSPFSTGHHVSIISIDNPVLTQDIGSEIIFVPDRWLSGLSRNKDGLFVIEMRMLINCR